MMKRPLLERRWIRPAVAWALLFVLSLPLDGPVYRLLYAPQTRHTDWAHVLRQLGYLPTWLIVGLLFWLADAADPPRPRGIAAAPPHRRAHHRAGLVVLAAVAGGLAANVLKPLLGRLRPDADGVVAFASRPEFLWAHDTGHGFGLPSGHTTLAFAACTMVALLVPAWRWVMFALAAGCGLMRLLAGAHALSDVVAGAGLGMAVAWGLYVLGEGPRRGPGGGLIPRG